VVLQTRRKSDLRQFLLKLRAKQPSTFFAAIFQVTWKSDGITILQSDPENGSVMAQISYHSEWVMTMSAKRDLLPGATSVMAHISDRCGPLQGSDDACLGGVKVAVIIVSSVCVCTLTWTEYDTGDLLVGRPGPASPGG
jgi:hypothetical protein